MHESGKSADLPSSVLSGSEGGTANRVIPVVREEISVSRVSEETGAAVRVRIVPSEEKQTVSLTDIVEEISVERVPINRFVSEPSLPREEGDAVIVPVFETVAVVEKRLLLKEEVRIVRHRREVVREEEVVVRRETPIIEYRTSLHSEWSPKPPE